MAKKKTAKKEYTAEQIIKMIDDQKNSEAFMALRDQMQADFDLYSLEPYEAEPEHQAYTSPGPRNDFLKVFHSLNKADLTWRIVTTEKASEKEREAANDGENFLSGMIAQADRKLKKAGEPKLRHSAAWWSCGRGALGALCNIYVNDDKEIEIDLRTTDPMHLTWKTGQNGLRWVAFEYVTDKEDIEERYPDADLTGLDKDKEDVEVVDFYNTTINAVLLRGKAGVFVKEPTEHNLDHVPAFVGFAGYMPTVYDKDNKLALVQRAASVYASSRGIYEPRNKAVSFVMDVAEKSVAGTLVYESLDGKKTIKGDPFASWQVVSIAKDEKITELKPPEVPAASQLILGILDRDKQESTVPYPLGYGMDPAAHSGTALAMLNDNMKSTYSPFCGLLEDAFQWFCEEILLQFKKKGKKIKIQGYNNSGKYFEMDASPDDISDEWHIEVTCEPKLPRDEMGEITMALSATNERGKQPPLLSVLTAREKILQLPNPDAEAERIDDERVKNLIESSPSFIVRKYAKSLLEKGDREGAEEFLASLPSPQGGAGQPGGGQPMAQGVPAPTASEIPQILNLAESLLKQGRPLPPELQAVLRQIPQMTGQR